jgi:TP901 family phage tail tape measure protein
VSTDISSAAERAAMSGSMSQHASREVSVLLSANTGPYQQEMKKASEATAGLADALHKVELAYKGVLKFIGRGMIGIGASMQATATGAVWSAAQFEESFARVAKTTGLENAIGGSTGRLSNFLAAFGAGDNQLQKFENRIRALSTEIPVAVQELSYLADVAGTLDVEPKNLDLYAEVAANLGAAINELDSASAITGLSNMIGAFGDAENTVTNLGSSLADLANHTRGNASEMLMFSQRIAGTAVQVGMASEEVLGLGAAISSIGALPEAGATAIMQTVTKMSQAVQRGGEDLANFARAMGMTEEQLSTMWAEEGATAVLMRLLKTLSEQGEGASITLHRLGLSGVRTGQVLGGLAAQFDDTARAMGISTEAYDEGSAVAELAAVRYDTLAKKLQRLRQASAEVFRSMGQGFLEPFKLMTDVMTELINIFNAIPQPIKTTIGVVLGVGGAFLTAAGAFTLFFATFHGFFLLLHSGPILLRNLGNWLVKMGANAETVVKSTNAMANVMERFARMLTNLPQTIQNIVPALNQKLGAAFARIGGIVSSATAAMRAFWASTVGPRVSAVGAGLMDAFAQIWPRLAQGLTSAREAMAALATAGMARLRQSFTALGPILDATRAGFVTLTNAVRSALATMLMSLSTTIANGFPQLSAALATMRTAITATLVSGLSAASAQLTRFSRVLRGITVPVVLEAVAAMRALAVSMLTTLRTALATTMSVLTPFIVKMVNMARTFIVHETITTYGYALRFMGNSAIFATKAISPLLLALGKFLVPLALLAGMIWAGSKAWEAWKTRNDEAAGAMESAARSARLAYEELANLNEEGEKFDRQANWETRVALGSQDFIETLKRLDDDAAQDRLTTFRLQLLLQGNAPSEVDRLVSELARLSNTPWNIDVNLDLTTKQGLENAIGQAGGGLGGMFEGLAGDPDDDGFWTRMFQGDSPRVRASAWSIFRGKPTKEVEKAIDEELNAIRGMAEVNEAAALSMLMQAQDDLNRLLDENVISHDIHRFASRQLQDVIPDAKPEQGWFQRNIASTFDLIVPWNISDTNTDPRASLATFMDNSAIKGTDTFREMGNVIREVTGESGRLVDIINSMTDEQVAEVTDRLRGLSAEMDQARRNAAVMGQEFATGIEHILAMGSLDYPDPQDFQRFRTHIFDTYPQQVGFVQALEEAESVLERLRLEQKDFTEEADLYRQAVKKWSEEYAQIRVKDISAEINALPAIEQVRRLNAELRQLDMKKSYNIEIAVQVREMRQQALDQEIQDFRQVMGEYDRLIDQREESIRSHNERLEQMEEDHNRRISRMHQDHTKNLGRMEEQRAKSVASARENYAKRLEDIAKQEKQAMEDRVEQVASAFKIMERIQARPSTSIGALAHNMAAQNRAMDEMVSNLNQLESMGLSRDVMKELGFTDPQNFAAVRRLLQGAMSDPGLIAEINSQWKRRLELGEAFTEQVDKADITERFDEMRKDAKKALDESIADINSRYREQVAEAKERFAEQLADANENYTRSVEDAEKNHTRQLESIAEALANLGRQSLETIDELIEKASESGLEKLAQWAQEIKDIQADVAALDELLARRNSFDPTSPAEIDRRSGIRYDEVVDGARVGGRSAIGAFLDGFKSRAGGVWRNIQDVMAQEAKSAQGGVETETQRGVDRFFDILNTLPNQDGVWNPTKQAGKRGAQGFGSEVVGELDRTTSAIDRVMQDWASSIEGGLNPVLAAVGEDPIEIKTTPARRSPAGGRDMIAMAQGGMLPDQATIQSPGTLVQWAEPETGGEAFIPLAKSKRGRSRMIWEKTGELLGIDMGALDPHSLHSYAQGGIHNVPDMSDMGAIGSATEAAMLYVWEKIAKHLAGPNLDQRLAGGGSAGAVSGGWQAMWNVLKSAFPGANLHSGYRPGAITATVRPSYHGQGRAIDVTPSMDIAEWIRANFMAQTREMIYSPMNSRQIHNGKNHYYATPITRAMHWDHVHWAMAAGDVLTDQMKKGVDNIPLWASQGEFIMQADAVKEYGLEMMEAVNAKKFANGGLIGSAPKTRGREPMGSGSISLVNALTKALENASLGQSETNHFDVKVEGVRDVNEMIRKLEEKKRLARLTGGARDE